MFLGIVYFYLKLGLKKAESAHRMQQAEENDTPHNNNTTKNRLNHITHINCDVLSL